jgi:hypothetical protein
MCRLIHSRKKSESVNTALESRHQRGKSFTNKTPNHKRYFSIERIHPHDPPAVARQQQHGRWIPSVASSVRLQLAVVNSTEMA